jgi:18S rRNA (guanine1575-N7)-methyltransferase
MSSSNRPESQGPPELFYNERESKKYHLNSRIISVQNEMSLRAIELLSLDLDDPEPKLILDLGSGSGLSGRVVEKLGHYWIGCDISLDMLKLANKQAKNPDVTFMELDDEENEEEEESADSHSEYEAEDYDEGKDIKFGCAGLCLNDMGQGMHFRPGIIDACISISALQWLSYSNRSYENPRKRLITLFTSLFTVLAPGARAVFQFYPGDEKQTEMILQCARKCGFGGGLVVDYPDTSSRKYYLCLMTSAGTPLPQPKLHQHLIGAEADKMVGVAERYHNKFKSKHKNSLGISKNRDWVLKKKAYRKLKGEAVGPDTKYTARKRRPKF